MKKIKYTYNSQTKNYEKLQVSLTTKLLRAFAVMCAIIVTVALTIAVVYKYIPSPGEQKLTSQLYKLQENIDEIKLDIEQKEKSLNVLQQKDNTIYRTIFEASPLPDSANELKFINEKTIAKKLSRYNNDELIAQLQNKLGNINTRINKQQKSYNQLEILIANKQKMLASIPSIQPVSNKQLLRIASGFGIRIDPIYKMPRLHTGLDFTAPIGTPIYATGNGTVEESNYNPTGYGNYVRIQHGYGYETLYGHMVKAIVHSGQNVKRGQVIGYVGSTGKSTGPHCHYEVIRNADKIDPVYFFYNDIKPDEYEQMVHLASTGNQSLD